MNKLTTARKCQMLRPDPFLLFFIIIGLIFPITGFGLGLGLEVDPGEINLKNVPLGEKVAVSALGGEKMKLRIENKSDSAYTYTIAILPTSETSAALRVGYEDIPDIAWIIPENKEVKIAGNSTKEVELYLEIPKLNKYYNKGYQAVIEVKSKKNRPQELFVLACQLKICFETEARGQRSE